MESTRREEVEKALGYNFNEYFYDQKLQKYYTQSKVFSFRRLVSESIRVSFYATVFSHFLWLITYIAGSLVGAEDYIPEEDYSYDLALGLSLSLSVILIFAVFINELLNGRKRKYFSEKEIDDFVKEYENKLK